MAAVLTLTQFTKGLGILKKLPTRLLSYIYAVVIMLAAEFFSGMLTLSSAALLPFNAIIVATAASGGYDAMRSVGKGTLHSSQNGRGNVSAANGSVVSDGGADGEGRIKSESDKDGDK